MKFYRRRMVYQTMPPNNIYFSNGWSLLLCVCIVITICKASEFCDAKLRSHETDDQEQSRILRGLINLRFVAQGQYEEHPASFTVSVCGNASKEDPLAGAVLSTKNHSTVLGRSNNTSLIKGGDWMVMVFGSGDIYPEKSNCSGPRVAFILLHCSHNVSAENSMRFVKEVKEERNKCFYMLEVHSHYLCVVPEKISGGTIFLVMLVFCVGCYLIGGTLYRRFILGAKGLEQIPNLLLWQRLYKIFMDCFTRVCCPSRIAHEDSWNNLGQRSERDDDSLLSP